MNRRRHKNQRYTDTSLIVGFTSVLLILLLTSYFFDRGNLKYTPIEYDVIINDSNYYSKSDYFDWHKIDIGAFYIQTPKEFKFFRMRGFDSYVAGLTNQQDTFYLDYGLYSSSLTDFSLTDFQIINELINDKEFRVVIGKNEIQYIAAYTEDLKNGKKLMIECPGCSDLDEKHKIIQTIEFKKK